MGIFYLSIKFELDRSFNNGDLSSDWNHWKHTQTHRQTDTQIDTQTESDTLPIYHIGSSNNLLVMSFFIVSFPTGLSQMHDKRISIKRLNTPKRV